MTFAEYFATAWESLRSNKLRSVLTMVGIIIGVGSVLTIVSIGQGVQSRIVREIDSLGGDTVAVFSGSQTQPAEQLRLEPISSSDMEVLASALPQARAIAPVTTVLSTFRAGRVQISDQLIGLTPAFLDALPFRLAHGRSLSQRDENTGNAVLVLGASPAQRIFPNVSNPTGRLVYVNGYPFEVVGVTERNTSLLASIPGVNLDNLFLAPFSVVHRMSDQQDINQVRIILSANADPRSTGQDAVTLLQKRHPGATYDYFSASQFGEILGNITGVVTLFVAATAAIALLVGGIGIMNIMLVSVTERTREIGVRMALGARRRDVLWQFVIESILICLVGGLIGVLLALIPVGLVAHLLEVPVWMSLKAIAVSLSFSAGVGVIFGVYPANKAARLDPIEALRYE